MMYMKNKDAIQRDKKILITYDRLRCELGIYIRPSEISISVFEKETNEQVVWSKEFDFIPPQVFETLKLFCLEAVASTTNGNHEERIVKIQWHLNKWGSDGYKVLDGKAEEVMSQLLAS